MKHAVLEHLHERMVQALVHLARGMGPVDRTKLVKLAILADRISITKLGHPITYDDLRALKHGPAGSEIERGLFGKDSSPVWTEAFEFQHTEVQVADPNYSNDQLSDAEVEVLDEVVATYGRLSRDELITLTHKYPEWQKAWEKGPRSITYAAVTESLGLNKAKQARALEVIRVVQGRKSKSSCG